jgi:hypothetical protein
LQKAGSLCHLRPQDLKSKVNPDFLVFALRPRGPRCRKETGELVNWQEKTGELANW